MDPVEQLDQLHQRPGIVHQEVGHTSLTGKIPVIVKSIKRKFSLEIILIQEEEIRRPGQERGWHSKEWITHEQRLLSVLDKQLFYSPAELATIIPKTLTKPFTTADLAGSRRK